MLVLLEAQEENWEEIDLMVLAFQSAVTELRSCGVPVVVAPAGLALGGGCEICLHGDVVQAAAETYMGQVEVGVGLVPAGGGTKELLVRGMDRMPAGATDPLPYVRHAFELIGFGMVSTSAPDAKRLGLLRDADGYTMNRERLMADAKARVLELAHRGYQPSRPRHDIPVGGDGTRASLDLGVHLAWRAGQISDHDALIGRKISHILAGGGATARDAGVRGVPARPGARGVPEPVRPGKDPGADRIYAEDGENVAQLIPLTTTIERGAGLVGPKGLICNDIGYRRRNGMRNTR